jgi:hypothetical protein
VRTATRSPEAEVASGTLEGKSAREIRRPLSPSSSTSARLPLGSRPVARTNSPHGSGSASNTSGPKLQRSTGSSTSGARAALAPPSFPFPGRAAAGDEGEPDQRGEDVAHLRGYRPHPLAPYLRMMGALSDARSPALARVSILETPLYS